MRNKAIGMYKAGALNEIMYALIAALLMFSISGCSNTQSKNQTQSSKMEFALIGDMPYNARQKRQFAYLMKAINKADLAFVIHDGDFWFDGLAWKKTSKGLAPCSDETFQDRLDLANNFRHPFILTPGDNDWTDCHRAKPRKYDPLERLTKLRRMFFKGDHSLGQRTIRLKRQSVHSQYAKFRENVRWTYGDIVFVTLHMVGSNNNLGRTAEMDAEYAERNDANLVWLQEAFEFASNNDSKAIMIIAQANPQFENTWSSKLQKRYMLGGLGMKSPKKRRVTGFDDFLAELETETQEFGKPVVYVHGDTHTFRIDKPLIGTTSRRFIENFTRVETFGFSDTHWLRVTIDHDDPNVFRFRQEIIRENKVEH